MKDDQKVEGVNHKEDDTKSESRKVESRRKATKAIVAGSATATVVAWKTPLLNSVVLPAHAQTSVVATTTTTTTTTRSTKIAINTTGPATASGSLVFAGSSGP